MRYRIVAAWKVLRGEWTAKPPEPTFTVYWNGQPTPNRCYVGTTTYTAYPGHS